MGGFDSITKRINKVFKPDEISKGLKKPGEFVSKSKLWDAFSRGSQRANESDTTADVRAYGVDPYTPGDSIPEAQAKDAAQAKVAEFERKRAAEEARARGQVAVRIRRGMRDNPSTKGGTIATSPTGLGSTGGFGSFAALLGL